MQDAVDKWIVALSTPEKYQSLKMLSLDWDCVKTLIDILEPFTVLTEALSNRQEPTINLAFGFYNLMFDHLEDWLESCENNELLHGALTAAHEKLTYYYSGTEDDYGFYYNLAAILDPRFKMLNYADKVSVILL